MTRFRPILVTGQPTVKDHTTKFLKFVAYLYLAFPVTYLLYATILFNVSSGRLWKMLFSFSFWVLAGTGIAVGYGFKEMRRWSWYIFLMNSLFVAYANALIAIRYSESNYKLLSFVVSIALLVGMIMRVGKEIRVPYFLPRIRWWESHPRYKLSVPVKVDREKDGFDGEILDISIGGCFVKTRTEMNQNEHIQVQFTIFGEQLTIGGTVVWRSHSSVTHPKGVGVKFDVLDPTQKKVMKAACLHLKKISAMQGSRGRMSEADFAKKMDGLRSHQLQITHKQTEQAS